MKNKSIKQSFLSILITINLLFGNAFSLSQSEVQAQTNTFLSPPMQEGWRRYDDKKFDFSFDYPGNWHLEAGQFIDANHQTWQIRLVAPTEAYEALYVTLQSNPNHLDVREFSLTNGQGWINCLSCANAKATTNEIIETHLGPALKIVGYPLENSLSLSFDLEGAILRLETVAANEGQALFALADPKQQVLEAQLMALLASLSLPPKNKIFFEQPPSVDPTKVAEVADAFAEPMNGMNSGGYNWQNPGLKFGGINWSPCYQTQASNLYHAGVDGFGEISTMAKAIANGVVIAINTWSPGTAVVIEHTLAYSGEKIYSMYAHLGTIAVVSGQSIQKGDNIGTLIYQPDNNIHLHWEVRTWGIGAPYSCPSGSTPAFGVGYTWPQHPNDFGYLNPVKYVKDHLTITPPNPPQAPPPTYLQSEKTFSTALPWYWLISTSDERVSDVYLDGILLFSKPGCAKALWLGWGTHKIQFNYLNTGNGVPIVSSQPWFFVSPACAAEPANPPPTGTAPPPSTPIPPSDFASFISDLSIPDDSPVSPNQALVKTWRLKNTGTTTWDTNYQLAYLRGDQMSAPSAVNLPGNVAPGQTVDISVNMIAPSNGSPRGVWQLRNPQGTYFGPEVWVQVSVTQGTDPVPPGDGNWGDIQLVSTEYPAVVVPGQTFRPKVTVKVISGQLLQNRGDLLRNTDGNLYGAWPHVAIVGTVNAGQTYTFEFYQNDPIQAPLSEGPYTTKWRVWRNGNWAGPEIEMRFDVRNGGGTRPDIPTPSSPGDWAVFQGNTPSLCVTAMAGVQYWFEIFESAQTPNSGWINNNCWTPPALGTYGYQWHVKAKDPASGLESNWSAAWHFTIESATPSIGDIRFNPPGSAAQDEVLVYACADLLYKYSINSATDGSANGTWREIDNASTGYPCDPNNSANWRRWWTLPDDDGLHLLRFVAFKNGEEAVTDVTYQLNRRRPTTPQLIHPSPDIWLNTPEVTFSWQPVSRATSYHLLVSTNSDPTINPLIDQTFGANTITYTANFTTAYPDLYWRVTASNELGASAQSQHFGLDWTEPASTVGALPATRYDTSFQVTWGGNDDQAGIYWYNLQVRDASHPNGVWGDWLRAITVTTALYKGLPGHQYCFRSQALDAGSNLEDYPADNNGDTCTLVNPSAAPPAPWWNAAYMHKVSIVILNNDNQILPASYPMHLRFDNTTTPTAAELYAASVAANKGDDVRVVLGNAAEIERYISTFTASVVDLWFRLPSAIGPLTTDNTSYQLYYGNAAATAPPNNINAIFPPQNSSLTNVVGAWHLSEGTGTIINDSSGNGHTGSAANVGWVTGKFGPAGDFNGSSGRVNLGYDGAYNVNQLTVEAWIYPRGGGESSILRKSWTNSDSGLIYDFIVEGQDVFLRLNGNEGSVRAQNALQYNRWYHIAGTYDGSTIRIYVNGYNHPNWVTSYSNPLRTGDGPLYLGGDGHNNNKYFNGLIQHTRLLNVALTSFPYGVFGTIIAEPSVVPSNPTTQPAPGAPDLSLLAFDTFPYPNGGVLVQAIVQNVGNKSSGIGFLTDLYLGHLPTGSGDYNGSFQFWVNDPIAAGATVTLTTVITDLTGNNSLTLPSFAPASEVTGTLYAQIDTGDVVSETSNANNIYSAGIEICVTNPDVYELSGDSTPAEAPLLTLNSPQRHNFYQQSDQDWVVFNAEAGKTYWVSTSNLSIAADTYLYLYDTDGTTLLISNDDTGDSLASHIEWIAPASGLYYVRVMGWNPNVQGCGTSYDLTLSYPMNNRVYLPFVQR